MTNNLDNRAQILRRLGFLDALIAALGQRNAVCNLVAEASDEEEARRRLSPLLGITEEQAGAVLEIRLGQLTVARRDGFDAERQSVLVELDQLGAGDGE